MRRTHLPRLPRKRSRQMFFLDVPEVEVLHAECEVLPVVRGRGQRCFGEAVIGGVIRFGDDRLFFSKEVRFALAARGVKRARRVKG